MYTYVYVCMYAYIYIYICMPPVTDRAVLLRGPGGPAEAHSPALGSPLKLRR